MTSLDFSSFFSFQGSTTCPGFDPHIPFGWLLLNWRPGEQEGKIDVTQPARGLLA